MTRIILIGLLIWVAILCWAVWELARGPFPNPNLLG